MDLVKIDVVRSQPPQTFLYLPQDMLSRKPTVLRTLPHLPPHLGGDDQLMPAKPEIFDGLTSQFFRPSLRIHIGRVYKIDARVDRPLHDRIYRLLVQLADVLGPALPAKGHRPQTKLRNPDAGVS